MIGELPTKHALGRLLEYDFIEGLEPTDLGRVVTTHFLAPDEAFKILDGVRKQKEPFEIVAELELHGEEE